MNADKRGKIDYHMHSCFSEDADDSLEAIAAATLKSAYPKSASGALGCWSIQTQPRFLAPNPGMPKWNACATFRRATGHPCGVESDEPHILARKPWKYFAGLHSKYVIGSVHFVGENFMFNEKYYQMHTADEVYSSYFAELERMVRTAEIDIVAHFDIPSRTGIPIFGYNPDHYEKIIRSVLKTCIERGLALDVNVSGLRKPAHNLMPDPLIMKWYVEMGGKHMTLGSDAHRIPEVGLQLEKGLETVRAVGINRIMQFKQSQAELIPL